MPQLDAHAQTVFWSRQFAEHLQFLSMLFTDTGAKREATQLHGVYEKARVAALAQGAAAPQVIAPAHEQVRAFQAEMFDRLQAGTFLGWAFPLFVSHITREMDLYAHLVYGTPAPDVGVDGEVKRLGAEHAQFAAHLLDPTERDLVMTANQAADALYATVPNNDMASNAAAAKGERTLITFLQSNKIGSGLPGSALSIIPKALADHVVREQVYFAQTLERNGGAS